MANQIGSDCPLAAALATRLRASRLELTTHWLTRIVERVSIDPNRVFPTEELLDHVPLLIDGIAAYLENPSAEISVDMPVVGKAMELGALRHAQGFDAYEILKEHEILGGILFSYLAQEADTMPEPCAKSELLVCGQRLFRAITIIQQTTTTHFLRLAADEVREREERIRTFNRAVSHEIKNRIGTILGASDILSELPDMPSEERTKFVDIVRRNARMMQSAVANILAVGRSGTDVRHQKHISLRSAAQEAIRQVREAAHDSAVDLQLADDLIDVDVNAAAVELCLTNYLSNAIKYADPSQERRWAVISAKRETSQDNMAEVVVRVTDNGLGVPTEKRDHLFERFFRAHETITEVEGTGLGLSIVRDTARSQGGRAWAEFPECGSEFAFSLPDRRSGGDQRTPEAATPEGAASQGVPSGASPAG
ncbi:MAG: HAMP domain-containing histidine kinase [Gemmatimonadota bacterium]|nr:HAMP domain-containing histidine kinase [Gemmatimonadota bacterium]